MNVATDGFLKYLELQRESVPDWAQYPFSIPAIRSLERLTLHPRVTFFVGENGSGKSTLIEAIALLAGFNAEGGSKNFSSRHRPSESDVHRHMRLARSFRREKTGFFLRAETMFNVATEAEAYAAYGWEPLHEMSHGEQFLWVVQNRFRAQGLYVLDEPESALSPQRQLVLLGELHRLSNKGCQFIIATHSPILMAYPESAIYAFGSNDMTQVAYEDTEHYAVTKAFLSNPRKMMSRIFESPNDDDR